jgi:lipopolysaccharide transport system permease protein
VTESTVAAQRRIGPNRYAIGLVAHLVAREFKLRYRQAFLGWAWALAEPLMRFAVLSFMFTKILPLDIPNYSAHLFTGLIAWTWFSSGLISATNSAVDRQELFMRPDLPRAAVPVVGVLADGLDYLTALPILAFVLLQSGSITITALALPAVLAVQFFLTLGLGYFLCAANVYLRDVRHMVLVALSLLFYLTPIFYDLESVPANIQPVISMNPMTHLMDAYRAILIEGRLPAMGPFLTLAGGCVVLCLAGYAVYRQVSKSFLDEL